MPQLTIQTWNCFGAAQSLRSALAWKGVVDPHRLSHPDLMRSVAEPDIVCVQELYLDDAEAFFDGLEQPHKTRDDNHSTWWPLTITGSGLGVASRLPIQSRALRAFSRPQVGSERLARKGILHVRVSTGVADIDVITTHMQSGYDEKARSVRERQLRELRSMVDELGSPERAFVVCGDFNICGLSLRGLEYAALGRMLHDFVDLGAAEDAPTFHPHPDVNSLAHRYDGQSPAQRVDYVFFRAARQAGPQPVNCQITLSTRLDGHGPSTFASDHFGLRATLAF